jgi:hypothetical protein
MLMAQYHLRHLLDMHNSRNALVEFRANYGNRGLSQELNAVEQGIISIADIPVDDCVKNYFLFQL